MRRVGRAFESVLIGLILVAFIGGAQIVYVALNVGAQVQSECSDYLRDKPSGLWLKLNGCEIDLNRAVRVDRLNRAQSEYFAPVGVQPEISLFLKLSPEEEELIREWGRQTAVTPEMTRRYWQHFSHRRIEGVVQTGLASNDRVRGAIAKHAAPLAENWKIVEEGAPLPVGLGVLLLIPGLGLAALTVSGIFQTREQTRIEAQALNAAAYEAAPARATVLDVSPLARRLSARKSFGALLLVWQLFVFALLVVFLSALLPLPEPAKNAIAVLALGTLLFVAIRARDDRLWQGCALLSFGAGLFFVLAVLFKEPGRLDIPTDRAVLMPAFCFFLAGASWIGARYWTGLHIPELHLTGVNLLSGERAHRPGPFASGRYLSISLEWIWGALCTALGAVVGTVLFGITQVVSILFPAPNLLRLLGPRLVRPLLLQGSRAARRRRRYSSPEAREVMERDRRPPVVLLRSFNDDELSVNEERLFDYLYRSDRTFEELVTDQLWRFGPVVAIGRPGEAIPQAGAVREYVAHDQWQKRIAELTEAAAFIVLVLGPTTGFAWELQHLKERNALHKAILVMPPLPDDEVRSRWLALVAEAGIGDVAAYFAEAANVPGALCALWLDDGLVIARANERSSRSYDVAIDLAARALRAQRKRLQPAAAAGANSATE